MVYVTAPRPFSRNHFNKSALVTDLTEAGFGDYGRVNFYKIDKTLEDFLKRPGVSALN